MVAGADVISPYRNDLARLRCHLNLRRKTVVNLHCEKLIGQALVAAIKQKILPKGIEGNCNGTLAKVYIVDRHFRTAVDM